MSRVIPWVMVPAPDREFSIAEFVRWSLLSDGRFNCNYEQIRRAGRIDEACNSVGGIVLEEGDWEQLRDAVQQPQPVPNRMPYLLTPGHKNAPFIEAIVTAKTAETK